MSEELNTAALTGQASSNSGGSKFDSDKDPMDLLPMLPLRHVSRVLGFGARKYDRNNWRAGIQYSRLIGATLRHLAAFQDGENLDPETGLSHIDHALCELMFLSQFIHENREELDDRYKAKLPAPEVFAPMPSPTLGMAGPYMGILYPPSDRWANTW